jgi:Ser/Thr protein kinase RdoA (MazF antagonist)
VILHWHLTADGTPAPQCAAALAAVLEALGRKAGPEDHRTKPQRDHDALEEACRRLVMAESWQLGFEGQGRQSAVTCGRATESEGVTGTRRGHWGQYARGVLPGPPADVLDLLGLRPGRVSLLRDVPTGNGNWLIEIQSRPPLVLRRYRERSTREDLSYEHAVLRYLAGAGWVVPEPAGDLVEHEGRWYCPTRYVPGDPVTQENPEQQRRRGRDLARLHLALRGLGRRLGQRPGWQAQHLGLATRADPNWEACVRGLKRSSPRLGAWAHAAAAATQAGLAAAGAGELPIMVIHGDFAEWNVHYRDDRLAGVVDFALTHLDSRPYELAIARTYRAPLALDGYRAELAHGGWPLSAIEEAAIEPVQHAFRVSMIVWELDLGLRTGSYDLARIERQLSGTGTFPP